MFSEDIIVQQLISLLKQFGVTQIVISPGSRHFSLVHSLEQDSEFELYSVVDERSAAFFALGLIQQSHRPAAVCCSSGTACINYGSAIVEAYYQRLPLLVISSDRPYQFLNQMEDQMYDQASTFNSFTKYIGKLTPIHCELDIWYCNRVINETLIALSHHGNGPAQINIPFLSHNTDKFSVTTLPKARKINLHNAEISETELKPLIDEIKGKKIGIVWGQNVELSERLTISVNEFVRNFDAVIFTDLLSNCNCENVIKNTGPTFSSLTDKERQELKPDLIISIGANVLYNGEIKGFVNKS